MKTPRWLLLFLAVFVLGLSGCAVYPDGYYDGPYLGGPAFEVDHYYGGYYGYRHHRWNHYRSHYRSHYYSRHR